MSTREAMPEPWRSFLNELDRIATSTVRLDCIGGFVVTMQYGLSRPTADVDVLEIAPRAAADAFSQVAMLGGPLFQKYGVYLDRVTVAQPPYEYESRLQEMFPGAFQHLRLMALDTVAKQFEIEGKSASQVSHIAAVTFDIAFKFGKREIVWIRRQKHSRHQGEQLLGKQTEFTWVFAPPNRAKSHVNFNLAKCTPRLD